MLFYCGTLYKEHTVILHDDSKGKLSMVCEKCEGFFIYIVLFISFFNQLYPSQVVMCITKTEALPIAKNKITSHHAWSTCVYVNLL